jgi:uncharacterized membrane protein YkvA (DUF1232 family)
MHTTQVQVIIERIRALPTWAIMLLTVVYAISPVDLVPDPICGVGFLDDVGVIGFALIILCQRWFGGTAPATKVASLP